MRYLFSDPGTRILESISLTRTLYAFDFDGTLSPIASHPDLAKITSEIQALITDLSKKAPVIVISGRSIDDVRNKLTLPREQVIGNHGLEGAWVRPEAAHLSKSLTLDWQRQLQNRWHIFEHESGVFIEEKGHSLALHYRKSRNKKLARLKLFEIIDELRPKPRVILGKSVMNLVPPGGPHKGVALLEAMVRLDAKSAFYIGDDDTDEDVFGLPDSGVTSVRVGERRNSQAQFFIRRQSEVPRLLKSLIERLS